MFEGGVDLGPEIRLAELVPVADQRFRRVRDEMDQVRFLFQQVVAHNHQEVDEIVDGREHRRAVLFVENAHDSQEFVEEDERGFGDDVVVVPDPFHERNLGLLFPRNQRRAFRRDVGQHFMHDFVFRHDGKIVFFVELEKQVRGCAVVVLVFCQEPTDEFFLVGLHVGLSDGAFFVQAVQRVEQDGQLPAHDMFEFCQNVGVSRVPVHQLENHQGFFLQLFGGRGAGARA